MGNAEGIPQTAPDLKSALRTALNNVVFHCHSAMMIYRAM
jgi:hypothetical protein